jgi:hypothetical protein
METKKLNFSVDRNMQHTDYILFLFLVCRATELTDQSLDRRQSRFAPYLSYTELRNSSSSFVIFIFVLHLFYSEV